MGGPCASFETSLERSTGSLLQDRDRDGYNARMHSGSIVLAIKVAVV